jgi:hypothetical protein
MGKRSLKIGTLLPNIVLYNDPTPHPSTTTTTTVISTDLVRKPDLLLIFGTSLKVHGIKKLVKDFAKTVHANKGVVIFVNKGQLGKSEWKNVVDYWVEGDCDNWVHDLKSRVPHLWMKQEVLPVMPVIKTSKRGASAPNVVVDFRFQNCDYGGRQRELYSVDAKEDGCFEYLSNDSWIAFAVVAFKERDQPKCTRVTDKETPNWETFSGHSAAKDGVTCRRES